MEEQNTFWALKDVSFEVQPGEVVGVIGRNGAGKSTLLKILSRIVEPTSGRAEVRGRMGSLLEVGTGFHAELTGRENVYLNGAVLGMSRKEIAKKFDEIVAFAGVEKFLDTPVKRYSSGMYVRLAFAVAAHLEPEILVVDEVLAVGDMQFQKKCMDKMSQFGREGHAVLVVSHNASAISALSQKCVLLQKGSVTAIGPTQTVLTEYLSDALGPSDGFYDLTCHPARLPHHEALICDLTLSNANDKPTSAFRSWDEMNIALAINAPTPIDDARVAIAVEDSLKRRIFTTASYFGNSRTLRLAGRHTLRCTIPNLRLGTGRYLISASISTRGVGLLDSIDGCGWFEVEAQNCYGNGESYHDVYGPILENALWTLE
jgi:lipopolysaccharide transport system ATP-binding protein